MIEAWFPRSAPARSAPCREIPMLTFEDCLALCELTEAEIAAIAEHEHLPQLPALEMGGYLIKGPDGQLLIQHMIVDDIRAAQRRGDLVHAARLKQTLRQFIDEYHAKVRRGEGAGGSAA
jgi:hypothetical protein